MSRESERRTRTRDNIAVPTDGGGVAHTPPRVEIYVADHCEVCAYAFEVAQTIRTAFPLVDLHVINLSHTSDNIPESVFATPTYLLDGQLWSLGNPSTEEVESRLSQALRA